MDAATTVSASFAVPTITIAGDPRVDFFREPMDPRDKKKPRCEIPTRKKQSNACPGVYAAINLTICINCLHEPHGFLAIHLRKTLGRLWFVQIEELDALTAVEAPCTGNACAAQTAGTIEKYGKA